MMVRIALRGLAFGLGLAFLISCFRAYLDPSVFVPALSVLSLCK